jgi:hypothetical protein
MNHGKMRYGDLKFAPAAPNSGHHRKAKFDPGVEGRSRQNVRNEDRGRRQVFDAGFGLCLPLTGG